MRGVLSKKTNKKNKEEMYQDKQVRKSANIKDALEPFTSYI